MNRKRIIQIQKIQKKLNNRTDDERVVHHVLGSIIQHQYLLIKLTQSSFSMFSELCNRFIQLEQKMVVFTERLSRLMTSMSGNYVYESIKLVIELITQSLSRFWLGTSDSFYVNP